MTSIAEISTDPLYLTALASLGESALSKAVTEVRHNSIAVLPFVNLSGDPTQEFFTDGLTEDIITDLSNVKGLMVIARNSTFAYKGKPTNVRQIAYDLGVKYVLEGSARRADRRLRVNVQLIDAADAGAHLWAERFDRDYAEVFAVQDEVTQRIVGAVMGKLGSNVTIERYRPTNLLAYDLYMQARTALRLTDQSALAAIPLFERALELDPAYPSAHCWLAFAQCLSWLHFGQCMHPVREKAVTNARRSVELDPMYSSAHWVLGFICMYERLWDEAVSETETSLRLNPNDADAWNSLSDLRVMEGKGQEALECSERSLRLSPLYPAYFWLLGQAQFAVGDYEAAVNTLKRTETYRTGSRRILAAALAMLDRKVEAQEEAQMFLAAHPHFKISYWVETQPFRDLKMRDRFVEAYRLAGLPE